MWASSARFEDAVRRSHTATFRVEVSPGAGSAERVPLEVLSGSVTADRTRAIRRTVGVQLVDADGSLTPREAEDLLAPFGTELYVWRGIRFDDGQVVEVPLGVFRLTGFTVAEDAGGVVLSLEGSDRSIVVSRAGWEAPYVVKPTQIDEAIHQLLADRFSEVETNFPSLGSATFRAVFDGSEGDPWQDARGLAEAAGVELYFGPDGVATVQSPAGDSTVPVVEYRDGEYATILSTSRKLSSTSGVYNAVVASAEHSDLPEPLRAFVVDDDPTSPTYYHGEFGKVHRRWSSQLVRTQGQLDAAAESMLNGVLGASEDVEVEQVVNPALQPNDVVTIDRARAGLDDVRLVLDVVVVPLVPGDSMSFSGRRRFFG